MSVTIRSSATRVKDYTSQHEELTGPDADHDPSLNCEERDTNEEDDRPAYPIFWLTPHSDEYAKGFKIQSTVDTMTITSDHTNDNHRMLEIQSNLASSEPEPTPFLNYTVDLVYESYKTHIRNGSYAEYFTGSVFFVIDKQCVESQPERSIILCTDAPDFGEADDEFTIKQLRLSLSLAMDSADQVEQMYQCPSEVAHPSGMSISIMPPPWLGSTPASARARKKDAIKGIPSVDVALGPAR